jgi:hypothetical protein
MAHAPAQDPPRDPRCRGQPRAGTAGIADHGHLVDSVAGQAAAKRIDGDGALVLVPTRQEPEVLARISSEAVAGEEDEQAVELLAACQQPL